MKLNIGCGSRYLPGWENLDFRHVSQDVKPWDLRKRLPYADGSMDLVYSSHLLEHLSPEQAEKLLKESLRVLKPGGVVRVVVPDLEALARNYLCEMEKVRNVSLAEAQGTQRGGETADCRLQTADHGLNAINEERRTKNEEPAPAERYDWAVIFLIDQLVRTRCGGTMLARLAEYKGNPPEFLKEYFNEEWRECVLGKVESRKQKTEKQCPISNIQQTTSNFNELGIRGQEERNKSSFDFLLSLLQLYPKSLQSWIRRIALGLRWRWRVVMEALERALRKHCPGMADRVDCWRTARFLAQGERHQWMYDEWSMKRLLETCGFVNAQRMSAVSTVSPSEAEIRRLDMTDDAKPYQPLSLYMEGIRGHAQYGVEDENDTRSIASVLPNNMELPR